MRLRVLSLFAGIGGFDLGLESAGGFETVAFCETRPSCQHLLAHHWPGVPIFGDVRDLKGEDVGRVDVICGGFPCQDISLAGPGAGIEGARSGLWGEFARLIRELRPSFVLVENVRALLVRGFGRVAGDLAALGYDLWWDCIPASAVCAPHRRDRLWVVAYARGEQHEGFGDALGRSIAAQLAAANAEGRGDGCDREGHLAVAPRGADVMADAEGISVGPGLREGGAREEWGGRPCDGRRPSLSWFAEPDVGRVADGVPARVDRLHGLGNAVVPQIPLIIGRAIMEAVT